MSCKIHGTLRCLRFNAVIRGWSNSKAVAASLHSVGTGHFVANVQWDVQF